MSHLANCQCGNPLPCDTCCEDHTISLFNCNDVWIDYEVEPSPEESLKFDGMQSEPYSIHTRDFYLQIPKIDPMPVRGAKIKFGDQTARITEVATYGCDVILSTIRFFFPCTTTVSVIRCYESAYCDKPEDNIEEYGTLEVHFAKEDADSGMADDNHRLGFDARAYLPIDAPFEWTHEHYLQDGDARWQVVKQRNGSMIDRATYIEVEMVGDNCGC